MPHDPISPDSPLTALGWSDVFAGTVGADEAGLRPMRIATVHRARMSARAADGAVELRLAPLTNTAAYAVGDWVLVEPGTNQLVRLLDRRTVLQRRTEGGREPQLIAANVDTMFIVTSCNDDFNPARLERYLALANEAGATPVVVLTKADQVEDTSDYLEKVRGLQRGLHAVSLDATSPIAAEVLAPWCAEGQTVVLVGSSGVGKSTLLNTLTEKTGDEAQATGSIREDDAKGRHTTTSRSLHKIAGGALVIDTPGVRSLQVSDMSIGLDLLFAEIAELAPNCRFRDCTHAHEPGCAVQAAVKDGRIDGDRLERWQKLQDENDANTPVVTGARGNRVIRSAGWNRSQR